MEQSILVNKPIEDVRAFLQEKLSTLKFNATPEEDEFLGTVGHQTWLLRLEPEKNSNRTFLKASQQNASGPSLTRRIFSTLKLVDREEPETFNLRKLRALIETGEIPTVEGQPHGERSALGKILQPDTIPKIQRRAAAAAESRVSGRPAAKTRSQARSSHQAKTRARKESRA